MNKISPERLLEARKSKGKTQDELAKTLLIDQSAYSRKEKSGDFTDQEIEKLATSLSVAVKDILADDISALEIYKAIVSSSIKQEASLSVHLMVVGELLAEKKGCLLEFF